MFRGAQTEPGATAMRYKSMLHNISQLVRVKSEISGEISRARPAARLLRSTRAGPPAKPERNTHASDRMARRATRHMQDQGPARPPVCAELLVNVPPWPRG
eukprot:4260256-Prymnesium_polylepis.1